MTDSEVKKKVEPSLEAICGGFGGVGGGARVSRRTTRWRVRGRSFSSRDRHEKRDRERRRAGDARLHATRAGSASTARARGVAARVVP